MRRTLITSLALLLTISIVAPHAHAEEGAAIERTAKLNAIHINPLSIAFGFFGLAYERVIAKHVSLQVGAVYANPWNDDTVWALGAEIRPFIYIFRPAPSGFYVAPLFHGAYSRGESGGAKASGFGFGVGATIGWAWTWESAMIRAGLGAAYLNLQVEGSDGTDTVRMGVRGVVPTGELSFGFRF